MGQHTLQDLRTESKDIIDSHDGLIRVLGTSDIGLVSIDLLVRSLGRILGLDGWEFTACCFISLLCAGLEWIAYRKTFFVVLCCVVCV
jgi:hypothetical protein